jgi:type II secretory pathway component GspD/PulD (secretin)
MNISVKISTAYLLTPIFLATIGCSTNLELSDEAKYKPLVTDDLPKPQPFRGNTYVREVTIDEVLTKEIKSVSAKDIKLIQLFADIMPTYQVVPGDPGVNLDQRVRIRQHEMSIVTFIDYIEKLTGYDVEVKADRLILRSFITKTWNLASFSDNRSVLNRSVSTQSVSAGTQEGGSSTSSTSQIETELFKDDDEWKNLLAGAEKHLDIEPDDAELNDANTTSQSKSPAVVPYAAPVTVGYDTLLSGNLSSQIPVQQNIGSEMLAVYAEEKAYVHGIRSLGLITAAGPVSRIRNLDEYFSAAIKASEVVFNVQASIYEVLLDEKKEQGIDWKALASGTLNGNPFGFGFSQNRDPGLSDGLFNVTGSYTGSDFNIESTVSFLEEFGEVELIDQPSISSRNGAPAKISSPTELSYIANLEVETNEDNDIVVTPKFERLSVGVTLAVTARLLSGDKILLDIWPVISSINGGESFSVNGITFETPTVSRKELTTQVITTSGKPVYLGGIITKKIMKTLSGLPIKSNTGIAGVLKRPFEQTSNGIERRELVMVVTPTIVESSL